MQLELNFPEPGKSVGNKGVKPREQKRVVKQSAAIEGGDLANNKNNLSKGEANSLLEEILTEANVSEAVKKVKSNKGSPGIDGVTVDQIDRYMEKHWSEIKDEIRTGRYKPSPVRRAEIPKPNGEKRLLGIPNVMDRVIQQALLQTLTRIFDPEFSEHSYGFRPNRSAHDAVRKSREYMEEGLYIVVDLDFEKFFDRVNHDILVSRVARKVKDKAVLKLIRRYLQSGVMLNGVCFPTDEGTPQGGPLSPLLANILLD